MEVIVLSSSSTFFKTDAFTRSIRWIPSPDPRRRFITVPIKAAVIGSTTKTTVATSIETQEKKKQSSLQKKTESVVKSASTPSLAVTVCNALDGIINTFLVGQLHPSVDPRHVLTGNFAPVPELPPVSCPVVKGSIPSCLGGGVYIRNGPNPQYLPRGPHHLYDGDGMLHSILLPPGGGCAPATVSSRFVRTYKYNLEREVGGPVLPSVFAAFDGIAGIARGTVTAARTISGQMNPVNGFGVANTSLFYFANRLFALWEADLPYAVHVSPETGDISTIGRFNFDGSLFMGMTAHPKKDADTGEAFAFRYSPVPPYLTYFWFDRNGKKQPDVPIFSMETAAFVHDFAVTKRHAVFTDIQIVVNPTDILFGSGSAVSTDKAKVSRVGILPRYANSDREIRWFEVPGFNPIHTINAWEDGDDAVVMVAPNCLSVEHAFESMDMVYCLVEMVRIDMRTGSVSRRAVAAENLEFGGINQRYVGKKNRYVYIGIGNPHPKISGIVKLDLEASGSDAVVGKREFGEGCFGGEPFFVPNDVDIGNPEIREGEQEEDDGFVLTYVHDEKRDQSKFLVMDAKSPELDIVAEVLLPRRVPYGLHGTFLSRAEVNMSDMFHVARHADRRASVCVIPSG